ncbi:hypothetical protein [Salegentibacter sp.]|uniref:hypothetical protein n=1 Tax=Salegentibacter sp. TaxID=1903072 RepID=UPI003567B8D3
MKNFLLIFSFVFLLVSCKNQEENNEVEDIRLTEQEMDSYENPNSRSQSSVSNEDEEREPIENSDNAETGDYETETTRISNDRYVKVGESDPDCSCYCIDVVTSGQSELCLKDDEMYINARFSQSGNTTLVYYIEPSAKNTNEDIPWEDFDTNTPIAEITPTAEGMELDWKGFSIDGELAVDYAIYGKKTLEGAYKKQ